MVNFSIAYLGPQGTYSEKAAQLLSTKAMLPQATLSDVFEKVWDNTIDIGVVPAENSLEGTVRETLDLLSEFPLHIVGSLDIPIHHQLLSVEKDIQSIQIIYSHPQALAQCKKWIRTTMPWAKLVATQSTTDGLQNIEKHSGYIASIDAAKKFSLPILVKNIEDNPSNVTKFYVISKNDREISNVQKDKTFIFFTVLNRAGVLRDILDVFAKANINLTKIESRPSRERPWDYDFFAELAIPEGNLLHKKMLDRVQKYCDTIRIVGRT